MSSIPKLRPGRPGGKRDQNRLRRAGDLRSAGLRLFLARGIDCVPIDDVVKEAGVAKGSFYRYFKDSADLVDAIFAPLLAQVDAAFTACESTLNRARSEGDLFGAYQLLAQQLAAALLADPQIALLYLQECRGPATPARAPILKIALRVREKAISLTGIAHKQGLLRPFDGRVSALAVVGAVERLLFGALRGEDVGEADKAPAALISLILDGLRPR